ncbi:MAG: transposase [Mariprofundaceae bacterium]|nr:transposase [Mariprofundaceae bacterium]
MARKQYSKSEKARIAIEAIKGQKTAAELSSEYGVHGTQINKWKKLLLDNAVELFNQKPDNSEQQHIEECDRLYKKVGQLQIEVDWLKKLSGSVT